MIPYRLTFLFLALAFLWAAFFLTKSFQESWHDEEYLALLEQGLQKEEKETSWKREGIYKEIAWGADDKRKKLHLKSLSALFSTESKNFFSEKFEGLEAWMEEGSSFFPSLLNEEEKDHAFGVIRVFSAKEAEYIYSKNQLFGKNVHFEQGLKKEEHPTPFTNLFPLFRGKAKEMEAKFNEDETVCFFKKFEGSVLEEEKTKFLLEAPFTKVMSGVLFCSEENDSLDLVSIKIEENQEILCGSFFWNFFDNEAFLFSSCRQAPVQFFCLSQEKTESPSLSFFAKEMKVKINPEKKEKTSSFLEKIEKIQAFQNVHIEYDENIFVDADEAVYRNNIITLSKDIKEGKCKVSDVRGNFVEASQIEMDLFSSLFTFSKPHGNLKSQECHSFDFSSDYLVWDQKNERLTLYGNTYLQDPFFGCCRTIGEIAVYFDANEEKKQIKMIEAKGKTDVTFTSFKKEEEKKMFCPGTVEMNFSENKIVMRSEKENSLLIFEDPMGKISAENLTLTYHKEKNGFELDQVQLKGNVTFMHPSFEKNKKRDLISKDLMPKDLMPKDLMQYAIADDAVYEAKSKEFYFSANEPKRVLFFDQGNHLQISANGMKMYYDPVLKKECFQGIGNVRFSLQENELSFLKETLHKKLSPNR